jgi:hypothetical protein
MHNFTHVKQENLGKTGHGFYADGMVEHDALVGQLGMNYEDWMYRHAFVAVPIQEIVGRTLATFKEFPPRQKPASFTIDQAMEQLMQATSGSK